MADLIHVTGFSSTRIMNVPVGTFDAKGQISTPDVHRPYNILYICTGVIVFEFRGNDSDKERAGVLTTHGDLDPAGVPIQDANGKHLELLSPITNQPMAIGEYAVTASLARTNNVSSDNGLWSVSLAELSPLQPGSVEPELNIQLSVQGDDGIKFERISYTAFILTDPVT